MTINTEVTPALKAGAVTTLLTLGNSVQMICEIMQEISGNELSDTIGGQKARFPLYQSLAVSEFQNSMKKYLG